MNYRFVQDVTLEFKEGRVLNDDISEIFTMLLAEGLVEIVPDKVYRLDMEDFRRAINIDGVPLDKLKTVDEYKNAFDRLGIRFAPTWRLEDYKAEAERYIHRVYVRKQQMKDAKIKRTLEKMAEDKRQELLKRGKKRDGERRFYTRNGSVFIYGTGE